MKKIYKKNPPTEGGEVFTLSYLFRPDSGLKTGIHPEFPESGCFFFGVIFTIQMNSGSTFTTGIPGILPNL